MIFWKNRFGLAEAIFSRRMDLEAARQKSAVKTSPASDAAAPNATAYNMASQGGYSSTFLPDWDHERAIREGYKVSAWVYACIDRIAGGGCTVPWRVMRKRGEEWEPDRGHPYQMVLEHPNEFMTRAFLKEYELTALGISGNALVKIVRVDGVITDLFPLNPARYRPKLPGPKDRGAWILGYENVGTLLESDRFFTPDQVIHSMKPDPENLVWGQSPMRAVAAAVDAEVKMNRWSASLPDNAMVPSIFVSDPNVTRANSAEAEDKLAERYMSPERARRPMVAGEGVTVTKLSLTPEEMDWMESRRFVLMQVCAAYGVHVALFDPREQPRANAETAVRYMWENGIARSLGLLEGAINMRLVPRAEQDKTMIHFDLSQVTALQDTLPERLKAYETAVRNFIPPNRAFFLVGIPVTPLPPEIGDKSWMPGALVAAEDYLEKPDPEPVPGMPADPAAEGDGQNASQGGGNPQDDGTDNAGQAD